jgi:hypothetical protein
MQFDPEFRRMLANERMNELRGAAATPLRWPRLGLGSRAREAAARVAAELAGLRHRSEPAFRDADARA